MWIGVIMGGSRIFRVGRLRHANGVCILVAYQERGGKAVTSCYNNLFPFLAIEESLSL